MTVNTEVLDQPVSEEDVVSGHDAKRGGMDPALLGMMLFIASEVMFFAALFAAYFNARATLPVFPPEGTEFLDPWGLPLIGTIVLLISSGTMQWGTSRIRKGDRTGLNRAVAITLVLGVIFLGMQLYDYYDRRIAPRFAATSG
jgi:cytochrome c oxidase subunit 3